MKHIDENILRAIHEIFERGLALSEEVYTDEQVDEIRFTFDEMYSEFVYKCK